MSELYKKIRRHGIRNTKYSDFRNSQKHKTLRIYAVNRVYFIRVVSVSRSSSSLFIRLPAPSECRTGRCGERSTGKGGGSRGRNLHAVEPVILRGLCGCRTSSSRLRTASAAAPGRSCSPLPRNTCCHSNRRAVTRVTVRRAAR